MNELANTATTSPALLDSLAQEARIYSESLIMNMFQLGRVLTEAKAIVKHGEFARWVEENTGMSHRTANQFMAVYARFGDRPAFAKIEKTKLFKMLALPEGSEEQFVEDNDVEAMTTRKVEAAVKQVREEIQAEIDREREARAAAERRAEEAENREPVIPEDFVDELRATRQDNEAKQREIDRLADIGRSSIEEQRRLQRENTRLERELKERDLELQDQQADYDQMQTELLNLQSAQARGDAERVPVDELTIDVFSTAVRQFIGCCARMPHMVRTFSGMPTADKNDYDELLRVIEQWAEGARSALNSVAIEGGIVSE